MDLARSRCGASVQTVAGVVRLAAQQEGDRILRLSEKADLLLNVLVSGTEK